MTDWQPIETAPKDGTRILGFLISGRTPIIGLFRYWDDEDEAGFYPDNLLVVVPITHWMPLPDPPA